MAASRSCPSANARCCKPREACASSSWLCLCFRSCEQTGKTGTQKRKRQRQPPPLRQRPRNKLSVGELSRRALNNRETKRRGNLSLALYNRTCLRLRRLRNPDDRFAGPRQAEVVARNFLDQLGIRIQIFHFLGERGVFFAQRLEIGFHFFDFTLGVPHRQKSMGSKDVVHHH